MSQLPTVLLVHNIAREKDAVATPLSPTAAVHGISSSVLPSRSEPKPGSRISRGQQGVT